MLVMEKKSDVFGKRLKLLRNKRGGSQEDVAKAIGISRARYSHYENSHVEPDIGLIRKLADYFNVNTDYLIGRSDNPQMTDEDRKSIFIDKIATEFPDADLMFHDLSSMTAEEMEDVYDYIKFKMRKKGSE